MKKLLFILILLPLTFSCVNDVEENEVNRNQNGSQNNQKESINQESLTIEKSGKLKTANRNKDIAKKECLKIEIGDKKILESQTFPLEFEPFIGACFVTTYDAEFDSPPIGSVISIYKDGEEIYKFDSRFNPDSATCYVEAVAFQDLNEDKLQDIIVVGKCGAKSGDLLANEVFINDGNGGFHTSTAANDRLDKFNKIKEVSDFVKKNQNIFNK